MNGTNRLCALAIAVFPAVAGADIVVPRDFPTIQAAVDAAPVGGIIKVRQGTYVEELVIAKDLTILGAGADVTIVQAPAFLSPIAFDLRTNHPVVGIVRVTDGAHVRISGLTVAGPTPCHTDAGGVRAIRDAVLELIDARVTLIRPPDDGSCFPGFDLSASVSFGLPPFMEMLDGTPGTRGHGRADHVAIDRFLSSGIVVVGPPFPPDAPASTATLTSNVVAGGAATHYPVAQGGIQVNGAAVARVTGNTVRGTACTFPFCGPDPVHQAQSAGLVAGPLVPGTVLADNTVTDTDIGVYVLQAAPGACDTRDNSLADNHFFGIVIQNGSNDARDNDITGGEVGIAVVADMVDTTAVLRDNAIRKTSVQEIEEISANGFTATAIVK